MLNTGKVAPFYWLCRRRAKHRNNGGCPSSPLRMSPCGPHPEATKQSLSLSLVPLEPLALHRAQGKCLQRSESVCRPFKRMFGFLAAFHLTQMNEIFTDFHSQMFPDTGALGWGTSVELGFLHSSGGTSAAEISI